MDPPVVDKTEDLFYTKCPPARPPRDPRATPARPESNLVIHRISHSNALIMTAGNPPCGQSARTRLWQKVSPWHTPWHPENFPRKPRISHSYSSMEGLGRPPAGGQKSVHTFDQNVPRATPQHPENDPSTSSITHAYSSILGPFLALGGAQISANIFAQFLSPPKMSHVTPRRITISFFEDVDFWQNLDIFWP